MKKLFGIAVCAATIVMSTSCHTKMSLEIEVVSTIVMINESSHQIEMSNIIGTYYETRDSMYHDSWDVNHILLNSGESEDGSNMWSITKHGKIGEPFGDLFYLPEYMAVCIDGTYSYDAYTTVGISNVPYPNPCCMDYWVMIESDYLGDGDIYAYTWICTFTETAVEEAVIALAEESGGGE